MLENFGFFIGMILMISLIVMVSNKIKIAYPILLVLIGLGISFIPSIPKVEVNSHLIFMFFYLRYCTRQQLWEVLGKKYGSGDK